MSESRANKSRAGGLTRAGHLAARGLMSCNLILGVVSCSGSARIQQELSPVDAWVGMVRAAHAQADDALARGRSGDAQATLQAALEQPIPHGVDTHDRRAVAQDLLFRMAEISLDRGASEQALYEASRGLEYGRVDDVFTLNLLLASGHAQRMLDQPAAAAASLASALQIERRLSARARRDVP